MAGALAAALVGSGCVEALGPGWAAVPSLPAASPLLSASAPAPGEPAASEAGDGGDGGGEVVKGETTVYECAEVAGFCVTAGERRSLQPVQRPGSTTPVGRVVLCVYLRYEEGWESSDTPPAPVWNPVEGNLYVLSCRYAEDGNPYVRGYPRRVVYESSEKIPGDAVAGWEVAEYAVGLLGLERPRPVIAPPGRQLVGVETWFAVTSKLHYAEVSAQAGSTWATVRARFRDVTWDFGSEGKLACTDDAATGWDPDRTGDQQTSKCTKVLAHASGPAGLDATVTATWDIDWRSSDDPAWRPHSSFSFPESIRLDVYELQAVIR